MISKRRKHSDWPHLMTLFDCSMRRRRYFRQLGKRRSRAFERADRHCRMDGTLNELGVERLACRLCRKRCAHENGHVEVSERRWENGDSRAPMGA